MIDMIIDLIKRAVEKDEKSRKFAVTLADSYQRRISRFQDQLVLLGIALNFAAAGCALFGPKDNSCGVKSLFIGSFLVFFCEHAPGQALFQRAPDHHAAVRQVP